MNKLKIKKNDTVIIIAGKDKSTKDTVNKGKVLRVLRASNRVVVEGFNKVTKNIRKSEKHPNGGRAVVEAPIQVSNVMLICPNCGKPTRVGRRDEKKHSRYCKKCNKNID